jgi:hypothetical protein
MLRDLVDRVLPGKTLEEMKALLGSPEQSYLQRSGACLVYCTGRQRDTLYRIDSEWLLIWCDQNQRFQRYEIGND